MQEPSITLPFKIPDLFGGFAEVRGLARADRSQILLEFYLKETLLGVLKDQTKELLIPQPEIDFVRHERGWFADRVHLRVKSLKWLQNLPGGDHGGEIKLRVSKRDRSRAVEFVQILEKPAT